MIRRGFWLTAGAVTGIYGYRRVAAVARRLSASLTPRGPLKLASPGPTHVGALARETFRFTRDVQEGMELYMARHSGPAGPTLSADHDEQPKDGH